MFTGIIEETGTVGRAEWRGGGLVVEVLARRVLEGLREGDSISVDGVCLTVTRFDERSFRADVMPETARGSTLGDVRAGDAVNLERALAVGGRLGGHLVSGHVDGKGRIVARERESNATWLTIAAGEEVLRYVARKGSVAIDGVSLTVASVAGDAFRVSVIPRTGEETTLTRKEQGAVVNVETDIIARYVERLSGRREGGLTLDYLKEHGF
jgi:riboflavin synthase